MLLGFLLVATISLFTWSAAELWKLKPISHKPIGEITPAELIVLQTSSGMFFVSVLLMVVVFIAFVFSIKNKYKKNMGFVVMKELWIPKIKEILDKIK